MIVNVAPEGWEIIFQRAHGLLAAQIGWHWRKKERPSRWLETLAAVLEHDDGQENWHGSYHLTPAGTPIDFTLQQFSLHQAKHVTETASYKSRWIALLISMHTSYLYESLRGSDQEIDVFLDEQKANQAKWRKELGVTVQEATQAYHLLHWCDRCSLILCKNQLPDDERALEVFKGTDSKRHDIVQRKDGTLSVTPWCFEEKSFEVSADVYCVRQVTFKDDRELFEVIRQAPVQVKTWQFVK